MNIFKAFEEIELMEYKNLQNNNKELKFTTRSILNTSKQARYEPIDGDDND
ncbi:MAG: hypothetical protein IPO47_13400 [Bacteroidetes bacterium]|nr:hypothetical protein [Bacteroidota bacterium]